MSLIQLEIPDDLLDQAKRLAEQIHVPLDQIVAEALQQRVSVQDPLAWFTARAERGRSVDIKEILRKSPDVERKRPD